MRRIVALVLFISGALYIDGKTAIGPRRVSRNSIPANAFQTLELRSPAAFTERSRAELRGDPFMNFDRYGLIVQSDGDGGDTAQRTGMFYFMYDDVVAFERALDQLEVQPGIYVRHPYQHGFRSDPSEFSRDQQRALVIAMGAYGMHDRLARLAKAHALRFGKYQNRDIIGPSHVGEYIRAFSARHLYPVLLLTDSVLLVNSVRIVLWYRSDTDHSDDNNHVMSLAQSRYVMPTPFSWLARKVYKTFRPPNEGNFRKGESLPAQGALAWYHRAENGGNPLIAETYRAVIDNF